MGRHPYDGLPDYAYWRRAVGNVPDDQLDPVVDPPFRIGPRDQVATAGSCFAQHIGRYLKASGCAYLVTEPPHPLLTPNAQFATGFGLFTARYGNVYTARQLVQLFERAFGRFTPAEDVWRDGPRFIDPFRPNIQPGGFNSAREYEDDRQRHFAAVRKAFETLDVFVFTLGLTEAWRARADGAVFPVCPGVSGGVFDPAQHEFVNFGVDEVAADLKTFIASLRAINRRAKLILTVSPVPLAATAEKRHVLASTVYSKSVLRVAAETMSRGYADVAYFPSYEIISSGFAGNYFAADKRSVTEEGVAHVMAAFSRHYLPRETVVAPGLGGLVRRAVAAARGERAVVEDPNAGLKAALQVMCDEEALDAPLGAEPPRAQE